MAGKFHVHFAVFFLGALWLLVLPPDWGMGALLAAGVHELCHLLAVLACGGQVLELSLGPGGARMETSPLPPGKEVLCALAGPVGSFSLILLAESFPQAALWGLIQGAYNLMPIYPLDGGRFCRCLLPESACRGVEAFFLTLFTGISLWLGLQSREVGLVFLVSLWIPVIQRKSSCKDTKLAVQ